MSEWDFPDEWKVEPLQTVCSLITDGAHFSPIPQEEGEIIANVKDMDAHGINYDSCTRITKDAFDSLVAQNCSPRKGDVLLSKDGTIGRVVHFTDERKIVLLSSIAIIRVKPEIIPAFLSYVLTSFFFDQQLYTLQSGSALKRITVKDINKLRIPIPKTNQQRKIARILTTLDALIEKTEALIAKYQAIKQGLMHDLFTRGVDEHGHLRPTYDEAPELYKESELGWIPREWDCCELEAVVPRAEYGISVSLDDTEGIPVLRMNNLKGGTISVRDIKCSGSPEAKRLPLHNRDVLFNRTNSIEHVGRTSIWKDELPLASFASYLVRLVPDSERLLPEYLVMWLNLPETQIAIRQFATPGVHQVNINPTNLRRTQMALPLRILEQSSICSAVQQQESMIDQEKGYLTKLRLQKVGLMQDLLTGKVRVKTDPEEAFGA